MSILTLTDFETGRYAIPLNPIQGPDLQIQIDYVENYYLKRMFGLVLYDLFVLDLAAPTVGEPTDPRFVKVFNPFDFQDTNEIIYSSEGIKEMLKGFTYFYYLRDLNKRVTTVGTTIVKSANSENVSALWENVTSRYNEAVNTYWTIYLYMLDFDSATYPEFEGVEIRKSNQF